MDIILISSVNWAAPLFLSYLQSLKKGLFTKLFYKLVKGILDNHTSNF